MRKNATKLAAAVLSLAMVMTSVSMPASAATTKKAKLNKTSATLFTNGTKSQKGTTLYVTVGGKKVKATFKSSNTKVLTVGKTTGKVTAKKKGTATVKATYKKKTYSCKITVKTYVTSLSVSAKTVNLVKGKTATIKTTVKPSTASNKKVSFKSSNTSVATVTSSGKVTAKKKGSATITVTALGSRKDSKKATVKVNVTEPTVTPTETPSVATEGTITVSTNVSGASVKVASGSEIKAEGTATGTASGAAFTTGKLAIGTYEVTVSKEGYKDKTESVSIVNGDVNVDIQLEKLAEPTVATASAIGAKKIQVALDAPATDTTKAKIIIKKGAVDVNTDKVTFSDDKKTALVETAAKLTKGDYTITVSGVATKDITTKLTTEDEKVAKIDVTTKTAPYIVTSDANSKKKALVSYKVYNQYGEDVTSATQGISWTVSTGVKIENSDVNVADGTVKITNSGNAEFIPGSKVYLTGVYAATGVVVNAELTVGVESKADQVVFKGVYNKSTKKFESLPANFADDKYLLLFDVNDQYGIKMAPATVADNEKNLVFTSSNPLFVKASNANITTIDVADTTYCALKLIRGEKPENGGKATIQVISNVTGKTASYDLDATAAPQLKTFTMSAPQSLIAKGDKVEIPFTAVDQYGKAFNNYKALNDLVGKGLTIPENSKFVEQNDGTAKLVYTANVTNPDETLGTPVYLTSLVTNGGSFSSVMVTVRAEAKPVAVIGIDKVATSIAKGNNVVVKPENISLQDQYGRVMPYDDTNYGVDVKRWLGNGENNKIVVKSVKPEDSKDKSPFKVAIATATDTYGDTDGEKVEISATTDASSSIKIVSKNADDLDSTEKLTFAIYDADSTNNILAGSEKTITFTETAQSEYKSYEVNDLGKMYNDGKDSALDNETTKAKYAKYNKTVEVFGITADGTKVALPANMFVVTTDSKLKVENAVISDYADSATSNEFVSGTDFKDNAGKSITKTVKVNVAIKDTATNSIATTITKDLVLSDVAPKVTTIGFNTTGDNKVENGKASVNGGYIAKATLDAYVKADDVKDQYGVKKSEGLATETLSYTISDVKKVDGSGFYVDESSAIYDAKLGDTFKVTYVQGDAKETVDFTVGAGIEYDSSASSAITSAVSSLDTALVKESQSNASSDKYEFDLSSTLSSVNSDIKVVAGTADLIEINKAKPSITVKQITQEDNSRDVTFTVTISKRGGQTVTKTYKLTIDANGTSYSITDVTPA